MKKKVFPAINVRRAFYILISSYAVQRAIAFLILTLNDKAKIPEMEFYARIVAFVFAFLMSAVTLYFSIEYMELTPEYVSVRTLLFSTAKLDVSSGIYASAGTVKMRNGGEYKCFVVSNKPITDVNADCDMELAGELIGSVNRIATGNTIGDSIRFIADKKYLTAIKEYYGCSVLNEEILM